MSILNNARDSIIMGLEDYSSSDRRRLISCTRNLFAGILLLFKYKLSLLSPPNSGEALIKERVRPTIDAAGNLQWVGRGKKTVDVQQINDRFESLNISVHWARVKEINNFRNDIEHYYSNLSKAAINALISNTFIVIRDFISQHLQLDPKDFLGEQSWSTLVSVSEVYEREKEECVKLLENIDWGSNGLASALVAFKCTNCGSGLITVREQKSDKYENDFYCRSCDTSWSFEDIAEHAIMDYFGFELYRSIKDEGDAPLIQCPECLRDSYIIEEEYCPICETKAEHECQRCGMPIPPEEINGSGFCSYCSYMMSKDE